MKRVSKKIAQDFLQHVVGSAYARSRQGTASARSISRDTVRSRDLFCRTTRFPEVPDSTLILIVDAVIKRVGRKYYTAYCFFLRPPESEKAVILPPIILRGTESQRQWQNAFKELPFDIHTRVQALVCDGHRGPVNYAKQQGWYLQRCHFHLVASIQGRHSRWAQSRLREEGRFIFSLVREALTTHDEARAEYLCGLIRECAGSVSSRELKRILLGFVNNYRDYRSYQYVPELNLPTTTNTAESFIGSIEELCHRLRGFSTVKSFEKWTEALTKLRRTIKCSGTHQQNF